nr:hypothetical protein [Oligoflexales bacterium]
PQHLELARKLKALIASYQQNFDYVQFGSYVPGTNPTLDAALVLMPAIDAFLAQNINEKSNLGDAILGLKKIFSSQSNPGNNR